MNPPPPWIPSQKTSSSTPSTASATAAPSSPSPTASAPCATPTRSSSSKTASSPKTEPTTNYSTSTASTQNCTDCNSATHTDKQPIVTGLSHRPNDSVVSRVDARVNSAVVVGWSRCAPPCA